MISQANILPTTPMGANLVDGGGATFRAWAPRPTAVFASSSSIALVITFRNSMSTAFAMT